MDSTTSPDTRTTEELLAAARGGDEGALAVLVGRHRGRLERVARLRLDRRPGSGRESAGKPKFVHG